MFKLRFIYLRSGRRSQALVIWFACCLEPFQCSSLLASWLGPGSVRTRPEEDTPGDQFQSFRCLLSVCIISEPGSLQKKTRRRRQSKRFLCKNTLPSLLKIYRLQLAFIEIIFPHRRIKSCKRCCKD